MNWNGTIRNFWHTFSFTFSSFRSQRVDRTTSRWKGYQYYVERICSVMWHWCDICCLTNGEKERKASLDFFHPMCVVFMRKIENCEGKRRSVANNINETWCTLVRCICLMMWNSQTNGKTPKAVLLSFILITFVLALFLLLFIAASSSSRVASM